MGSSYQWMNVLTELTALGHELGIRWACGGPAVFGYQVGDVLFWKSWGRARERRPNYWEHDGVVLLVIGLSEPEPAWVEVQGFNIDPPHTRFGRWRWGAAEVLPRQKSGRLVQVSSLCAPRSAN